MTVLHRMQFILPKALPPIKGQFLAEIEMRATGKRGDLVVDIDIRKDEGHIQTKAEVLPILDAFEAAIAKYKQVLSQIE